MQTTLNRDFSANLDVDGVFGKQTKKSIVNLERGAYGDYVRVLQGFLICHGYDTGGFDGDFGGRTESAVKTFQSVRGLYVDLAELVAIAGEIRKTRINKPYFNLLAICYFERR